MADGGQAYPEAGRWVGVQERSTTQGAVCRALNVVFRDGKLRRRPGRRIVGDTGTGLTVSRIFEHVTLSGSRHALAALTSPDPAVPPAMGRISPSGGAFEPIELPALPRFASSDAHFWAASYKGGHTIISDPTGRLLDYDGLTAVELAAIQGTDAANELAAARAYLWGTPPADIVVMWRNRIAAARLRTIGLSADAGDPSVPYDAPASGANVWPASTNFDVLTQEGDEIMGVVVQGDRLVCLLRRGVVVVDEDSVSPIPRVADPQYGCVAPRSVQAIGGSNVLYLADGVVCRFDGARSVPISQDIADTLELVNWTQAARAVSVHLSKKTEYRLWLPVKGRTGNRICVVYDYSRQAWTVFSGWYPFDRASRDVEPFDVTAAASVLLPTGEEALLTGDSQGRIWREDVGEDDNGTIFPACVALVPYGDGQSVVTFADWRIGGDFDGSFITGIAVEHGHGFEDEIVRLLEGEKTRSQSATVRMLQDDASGSLSVYGDPDAWGIEGHTVDDCAKRLGFRGPSRRLQPVLLLPGQANGVVSSEPGGIATIEISVSPAGGRRG